MGIAILKMGLKINISKALFWHSVNAPEFWTRPKSSLIQRVILGRHHIMNVNSAFAHLNVRQKTRKRHVHSFDNVRQLKEFIASEK